jgi:hypothetical protein
MHRLAARSVPAAAITVRDAEISSPKTDGGPDADSAWSASRTWSASRSAVE